MKGITRRLRPGFILGCCALALIFFTGVARADAVPFDSERWTLVNATMSEHDGRPCLEGVASLDDVAFQDGTIECDLYLRHERSYAGIDFRIKGPGDRERFYIRPHRAGHYPDAVQYVPVFNGIAGWQIYNGPGYTDVLEPAPSGWVHVKAEITGSQARFYVGDMTRPALRADRLERGISWGGIGVNGPRDGSACFAGFRYTTEPVPPPEPVAAPDPVPGIIESWLVSQPFPIARVDPQSHPRRQEIPELRWQPAQSNAAGVVDISRSTGRTGRLPDAIYAVARIVTDKAEVRGYDFGYSDGITIFLNGEPVFSAGSAYQQRDPSFLGILGYFDTVYLPLVEGDNELMVLVAEGFGGWGFAFRESGAEFVDPSLERAWETPDTLFVPESVVYDTARGVLYASNFDAFGQGGAPGSQFISRVGLDGTILEREWVAGLDRPSGMALAGDTLWVVERGGLAEIDIETGAVARRHPCPGALFPNDVAAAPDGALYMSDSGSDVVYRFADGAFERWVSGPDLAHSNGLAVIGERLFVGNNADRRLRAVNLETREVSVVSVLGAGTIDGVQDDGKGNLLVSHWEGRVFRIAPDGTVTKLLDTTASQTYCADFAWVPERGLLVCPTYYGGTLSAYRAR